MAVTDHTIAVLDESLRNAKAHPERFKPRRIRGELCMTMSLYCPDRTRGTARRTVAVRLEGKLAFEQERVQIITRIRAAMTIGCDEVATIEALFGDRFLKETATRADHYCDQHQPPIARPAPVPPVVRCTLHKRTCVRCGGQFEHRRLASYCHECRSEQAEEMRRTHPPATDMPTVLTGAVSELRACYAMMSLGYYVFRSMTPKCPVDLVAMYGRIGFPMRVEVKTVSIKRQAECLFEEYQQDGFAEYEILALVAEPGVRLLRADGTSTFVTTSLVRDPIWRDGELAADATHDARTAGAFGAVTMPDTKGVDHDS